MNELQLVNYSEKSVALLIEKEGIITEELEMIGGKFNYRLSCGPGWIFSRKKSYERLMGLFEAYGIAYIVRDLADVEKRDSKPRPTETPEYIIRATLDLVKYAESVNEHDPNEFGKNYPIVVRLTGGECIPINSSKLDTEFWFPDEGCDEQIEYVRNHIEEHFINTNTERYDHMIAVLKGECDTYRRFAWLANWNTDRTNWWTVDRSNISPESTNAIECLDIKERDLAKAGLYKPMNEEDRQRMLTGFEHMRDATIRRCKTWLKRYGVGKLSISTYWRDR